MQQFTGYEYLLIDIANKYGLDKETWATRIEWTENHIFDLEDMISTADEPILYMKAVRALRVSATAEETNHIMGLDCTASGLQIMAALMGCPTTAANVNLIDTGNREDVYNKVANTMTAIGTPITRPKIKHPVMTVSI